MIPVDAPSQRKIALHSNIIIILCWCVCRNTYRFYGAQFRQYHDRTHCTAGLHSLPKTVPVGDWKAGLEKDSSTIVAFRFCHGKQGRLDIKMPSSWWVSEFPLWRWAGVVVFSKVVAMAIHIGESFNLLTHWGRDKMDAISQTTFWSAFSWMKMFEFRLKFHGSLFLRVQMTIFQHWFR